MEYSQEHLKTMVYAVFVGQTESIMGNWKIENVFIMCIFFGSIHINYLCETVGKCGMFIVKEPFGLPCLRYCHVIIA